jgi:hypothetical protein
MVENSRGRSVLEPDSIQQRSHPDENLLFDSGMSGKANVLGGSLYHHIKSKDALFVELHLQQSFAIIESHRHF